MPWTLYGLCSCGLCIWTLYVTFIYTLNEAFFLLGRKISMQATLQAKIYNIFISSMLFPSNCKITKLKPLFKKESKTNPENFRPISLLPLISKVIEKIVYDQVDNFLLQNNILYNYQSGFNKNHSTDLCFSFLNDKILKGFDKGLFTGVILTDLQIVFDTINHEILLGKLCAIGLSEKTVA